MAHGFMHVGIVASIIHGVGAVIGLYFLYSISKSLKSISEHLANKNN